jgi:hypothetical protein
MTQTDRLPTPTTASARAGRRSPHSERRPSARLVSEAVVASYIHDISQRHSGRAGASQDRSRRRAHQAGDGLRRAVAQELAG